MVAMRAAVLVLGQDKIPAFPVRPVFFMLRILAFVCNVALMATLKVHYFLFLIFTVYILSCFFIKVVFKR